MLVALVENNTVLSVGHYKDIFPYTSFPINGPEDAWLEVNNAKKVNVFKDHDRKTQKLVSVSPYIENNWVYTVTVENKTNEELESDKNSEWANIRALRNNLLVTSDWTQVSDSPLTEEKKLEWATYRQSLRDITTQSDPFNITWPTKPI